LFGGAFLLGMNDQMLSILLKIMMNDLFGKNFTHYLPMCFAGFAFSPLVWPQVLSYITNPDNIKRNVKYIEGENEVYYFDNNIVQNFSIFLKFQLTVHIVLLTSTAFFLRKPTKNPSKISVIFQHMIKGEYKRASVIFRQSRMDVDRRMSKVFLNSIKNLPRQSMINSFSRTIKLAQKNAQPQKNVKEPLVSPDEIRDLSKFRRMTFDDYTSPGANLNSVEMKELTKNVSLVLNPKDSQINAQLITELQAQYQNQQSPQKDDPYVKMASQKSQKIIDQKGIMQDLVSPMFWMIVTICVIRSVTARYFLSSFKIMGLFFFKDDKLINSLGSFAYVGYITVCFSFGRVFDFLGLKKSFLLMIGSLCIGHFLYGLFTTSLLAYVLISILQRVN